VPSAVGSIPAAVGSVAKQAVGSVTKQAEANEAPEDAETPAKRRTVMMVIFGSINLILIVYFVRVHFPESAAKSIGGLAAMIQQHRSRDTATAGPGRPTPEEGSQFRPHFRREQPVTRNLPSETSSQSSEEEPAPNRYGNRAAVGTVRG